MSAVDKVLAALDAGLQTSDEHGYPPRIDHPELCARCLAAHHVEGGDLCQPCRAWMLGDSDVDPSRGDRQDGVPTGEPRNLLSGMVMHHVNGNARDNRPENLRIVPAAHRWLVACRRCGARYSVDQQRRDEGLAIMRRDGHGEGGLCMLGVALQDSEDEDDRISATVDLPAPWRTRDWQAECFAQLRRVVAASRERLGL